MRIELPESMREWIEQETRLGGYANASAFVQAALVFVKKRLDQGVEKKLLEGLESGEPIEATPAFWAEQRRKLEEFISGLGKAAG